jgi:hypothetical protein
LARLDGGAAGRRGPTSMGEVVRLSATVCGLPTALSRIVRAPERFPAAVGLNVTAMAQVAPALTLAPQVFVWMKSPLAVMLEMRCEPLPVRGMA